MKKTYIIPDMGSCSLVMRAAGSQFKDPACKYPLPRISLEFTINSDGCAQYITDKQAEQDFIEGRPLFVTGKMIVLTDGTLAPTNPENTPKVERGVKASPAPAEIPTAPTTVNAGRKGAKVAQLK